MKIKIFEADQFHDSFLFSIDFADWRNNVSLLLWCPNAGEAWEEGRYLKIIFSRLLFFGFEVAAIGEFGPTYPMLHNIVLAQNSKESNIWRSRIEKLAQHTRHYPQGISSPNYSAVYHFILDSIEFEGMAFLPKMDGFDIICRDFDVLDVTFNMPTDAPKYIAASIVAG